jgi:iron complex outermembrane recepter protein
MIVCGKQIAGTLFMLVLAGWVHAFQPEEFGTVDSINIPEVEVTATLLGGTLQTVSGSIAILSSEQLETQDQLTITRHFNALPGIFMHSGNFNTNRIVIRGIGSRTPYSSNRIRAYLNDIPLTNGDGVTTLEDIDVGRLGRVEVLKGPNSALYGAGLGGTIKLNTQLPDDHFTGSYRMGSFNTSQLRISGGHRFQQSSVAASVHRTHSDGYRENNRYNRLSGYLEASNSGERTQLSLTLFAVRIDAQIPSSIDEATFLTAPQSAASNWLKAKGYEKSDRMAGGLTLLHRFNQQWSTKTTLFAGYSNTFEHRPFNDLADDAANYGIRSQLQYHAAKLNMITGVELYTEQYHWSTSLLRDGQFTQLANVDENRRYANIFGLMQAQINPDFSLSAGFNVNSLNYLYAGNGGMIDRFQYPVIVSPRLGLNYAVNPLMNLYASLGHGFSSPSLEETLQPDGEKNPDLKPETGWMAEVGLRLFDRNRNWFLDGTLYAIRLDNLLVTKRISEENFMGINAGRTHHAGAELQVQGQLFSQKSFPGTLLMNAALTLSSNRFKTFESEGVNYDGKFLPGIPAQLVHGALNWKPVERITVNLLPYFFGKQFLDDANSGTYGGVFLLDVNGRYQLFAGDRWKSTLQLGINNLFDRHYASMLLVNAPMLPNQLRRPFYPGLPRNLYFSLLIEF